MREIAGAMATTDETSSHARVAPDIFGAVRYFGASMDAPAAPPDGLLTVRVIGEFSAGKTRFLRELLGPCIPNALLPISSLERQTRLALEITYGPQPELQLIERPHDARPAVVLSRFDRFPARAELSAYDPSRYRLRLAVPETRLILRDGDGYSEDPRRLALVDMPGWNSGDDDLAEGDASAMMAGHWNLALGYVCQASRLDGEWNQERLCQFLEALAGANFFGENYSLLFIITQCPAEDRVRLEALARDRVLESWRALDEDPADLDLLVLGADFSTMPATELQRFRQACWQHLLAPLGDVQEAQHPWLHALQAWGDEGALRPRLQLTRNLLERAGALLCRARKDGEFLAGMNMYRLIGLDDAERHRKLKAAWQRQLGLEHQDDILLSIEGLALPAHHPLHAWWTAYWMPQLQAVLDPARQFLALADRVLSEMPADTPDLLGYLAGRLTTSHVNAMARMENGFVRVVDVARGLVGEAAPEKVVATLLTLSLLHTSLEPYLEPTA